MWPHIKDAQEFTIIRVLIDNTFKKIDFSFYLK